MSQLVGEQLVAGGRARCIGALVEEDVPPGGESMGRERRSRLFSPAVGVDPHAGEVVPEGPLHAAAHRIGQRCASGALDDAHHIDGLGIFSGGMAHEALHGQVAAGQEPRCADPRRFQHPLSG